MVMDVICASTLCKYDLRTGNLFELTKGDLFVLSWVRFLPTRGGTVRQQTTPANRDHLYPDSLLFVSAGFLPLVSSQRLH